MTAMTALGQVALASGTAEAEEIQGTHSSPDEPAES